MEKFTNQFYSYMNNIPRGNYGELRDKLCQFMNWSYWQYNRRLHGDAALVYAEREKIEVFFNAKIFG